MEQTQTLEVKILGAKMSLPFTEGIGPHLHLLLRAAKDCPFCRSLNHVHLCKKMGSQKKTGVPRTRILQFKVRCLGCGGRAGHGSDAQTAIDNWQQRGK